MESNKKEGIQLKVYENFTRRQKIGFVGVILFVAIGTLILFLSYLNLGLKNKQKILEITQNSIENQLDSLEFKLQTDFKEAQKVSDSLSLFLDKNVHNITSIVSGLPSLFQKYNFSAIGIHPSVNYSKKILRVDKRFQLQNINQSLYSVFHKKENTKPIVFPYDYTDSTTAGKFWYSENLKKGSWTKPYLGQANNAIVVSYRSPIGWNFRKTKNNGIICLDYSLGYIQSEVAKLKLLRKGHGIIINEDAFVISHPSSKNLGEKITDVLTEDIFSKISDLDERQFLPIYDHNDRVADRDLYYKRTLHISNTDTEVSYQAIIILKESETLSAFNSEDDLTHIQLIKSMRLLLVFAFTLLFSLFVFALFIFLNSKRFWFLGIIQACIYIAGAFVIIYLQLKTPLYSFSDTDVEISNETDLEASLNAFKRENEIQDPNRVKVGVFLQNVKFSSANDLKFSGYLWQKIDKQFALDSIPLDEILQPDFPEAESLDLELLSVEENRVSWFFSAEIRQSFDYSNYPFDEEDIWLRIRPKKEFQEQLLFVPDLTSYKEFISENEHYLHPEISKDQLTNGLDEDLFIKGWDIVRTSFSLRNKTYSSSFGKYDLKESYASPELYFNIVVKRRFLEVFVVYIIPIIVIAFLLFTVLMIYTLNSEKNEFFGFNASTVLAFCASLFFVIIVSHMALRESLQAGGIIYLEYYFFCLYFLISIVSICSILFSIHKVPLLFKNNDGEMFKIFYWPLLGFMILLFTTIHFSIIQNL